MFLGKINGFFSPLGCGLIDLPTYSDNTQDVGAGNKFLILQTVTRQQRTPMSYVICRAFRELNHVVSVVPALLVAVYFTTLAKRNIGGKLVENFSFVVVNFFFFLFENLYQCWSS